jgi:hypothetical protein
MNVKNLTVKKHLPLEPYHYKKRVGSTVYEVNLYFNQDAKETMNDKIMRLIRNEAQSWGPREVPQGLCGERRSDGVSEFSRLRGNEGYVVCDDEKAV